MKDYKKTFLGSLAAFFVGTSCCWLSSAAIWLGGASFFGWMVSWVESAQTLFMVAGILLAIASVLLYRKNSG